ncbi:MAG: DUF2341 domain-containing protein, partial [Kiritimatiellae bacterium]|nr:DUF2341 domain-containing protein [Kiritimatiellia bacterium]
MKTIVKRISREGAKALGCILPVLLSLAPVARADINLEDIKPDGFARGVVFTVDKYTGTEALTGFPVLVRISATAVSGFTYSDMMFPSTGDDIAFVAADGAALAYDIDTWNPNGTSLVWVRIPSMENETQFAMYYRSSKSGKDLNSANPFSDYVGVWHLNETGNGEVSIADAGPNLLVATAGSKSLAKTDGAIGGARQITTARAKEDKAIKVTATAAALDALNTLGRDFSVSFWARPIGTIDNGGSGIGYDGLIGRKSAATTAAWEMQVTDNPKKVRFWTSQTSDSGFTVTGEIFNFAKDTWGKLDV